MNEPELKPCPFCGGPAEIKLTGRKQVTVRCRRCSIKSVQRYLHQNLDWLWQKQIEAWNTRQPGHYKKEEE